MLLAYMMDPYESSSAVLIHCKHWHARWKVLGGEQEATAQKRAVPCAGRVLDRSLCMCLSEHTYAVFTAGYEEALHNTTCALSLTWHFLLHSA